MQSDGCGKEINYPLFGPVKPKVLLINEENSEVEDYVVEFYDMRYETEKVC